MAGAVMGTAGYMAPEQVTGREVDRRADLFALGCVLYEMLLGQRAFRGEALIDTLHAITRSEPAALATPGMALDPEVHRLLAKCLAKERRERYQHADDLAVDLRHAAAEPPPPVEVAIERPSAAAASRLPWVVAATASVLALISVYMAWNFAPAQEVVRLSLPAAFRQAVTSRYHAISPDGRTIAYLSPESGSLLVRSLDSFEDRQIPDSDGAAGPFFSPDGRRLAFFASGRLMAVSLAGGAPREICDVAQNNSAGVWVGEDLYFVQWATGTGVYRVSSEGGEAREVIPIAEGFGRLSVPRALPGGVGLAIQESDLVGTDDVATRLVFFDGRESIRIDRPRVAYLDSRVALYVEAGTLFASTYDEASWQVEGEPVPLVDDVVDFAVSAGGTLAYRAGSADRLSQIGRVGRQGGVEAMFPSTIVPSRPQVSPDGTQLLTGGTMIHLWDVIRGGQLSLTDEGLYPLWEPGGDSVVYASEPERGRHEFRRVRLDDPGAIEVLHRFEIPGWPTGISPDGEQLLYYQIHPETERDIWVLPLRGGDPIPYLVTPASERSAVFSPDGAWVAFMSDKDGRENVYVRPAPGRSGAEVLVTPDGGREPRWAADGGEIYFRSGDGLWAAPVDDSSGFSVGVAELLFEGRFAIEEGGRNQEYAVFPDGDFLMSFAPRGVDELRVVTSWRSELQAALDRR